MEVMAGGVETLAVGSELGRGGGRNMPLMLFAAEW